jgi:hypothetical protein
LKRGSEQCKVEWNAILSTGAKVYRIIVGKSEREMKEMMKNLGKYVRKKRWK